MDWVLVLGLEEGLVECATLCVKSWVMLSNLTDKDKLSAAKGQHIDLSLDTKGTTKYTMGESYFFEVSRVKKIFTQDQQNLFDPFTIGLDLALHCQIKCN